MIDDIVDQCIKTGVERVGKYCQDPQTMETIYSSVFSPVTSYLYQRMKWFVSALQTVVSLILLHTVLLVVILKHVMHLSPT